MNFLYPDIESTFLGENGKTFLSKNSVNKLTESLNEEYLKFCERDQSECDVVYLPSDAIYESAGEYNNNQVILCSWGDYLDS